MVASVIFPFNSLVKIADESKLPQTSPSGSPNCCFCAKYVSLLELTTTASNTQCMTLDLFIASLPIPIRKENQKQFAFMWGRQQDNLLC